MQAHFTFHSFLSTKTYVSKLHVNMLINVREILIYLSTASQSVSSFQAPLALKLDNDHTLPMPDQAGKLSS